MFVYIRSEPGLWTVGHYTPAGQWVAESDHDSPDAAARRVAWLNGGGGPEPGAATPEEVIEEAALARGGKEGGNG